MRRAEPHKRPPRELSRQLSLVSEVARLCPRKERVAPPKHILERLAVSVPQLLIPEPASCGPSREPSELRCQGQVEPHDQVGSIGDPRTDLAHVVSVHHPAWFAVDRFLHALAKLAG